MTEKELIGLLRQDIKDLKAEMRAYRETIYKLPCKEIQAKVKIMWAGFWAIIMANVSLIIKIIFDNIK